MLIFYSLGKAFEIAAEHATRVEEVHQALARLTGVPPGDQILLHRGQGLDPRKTLADYGLPADPLAATSAPQDPSKPPEAGGAETDALFLYNRQHLLPGAPPPSTQDLVAMNVAYSLPMVPPPTHAIDHSLNPTLKALGELYRRAWADHRRAQVRVQAHVPISCIDSFALYMLHIFILFIYRS